MKNLFCSLLVGLLIFAAQQTANAQDNDGKASVNETAELVKSATAIIADLQKGAQDGVAIPDLTQKANEQYDRLLLKQIDLLNRIIEAGAAMPKSALATFKTEIAALDQEFSALSAKQSSTTQANGVSCFGACDKKWPNWWQAINRWHCKWICLWNS